MLVIDLLSPRHAGYVTGGDYESFTIYCLLEFVRCHEPFTMSNTSLLCFVGAWAGAVGGAVVAAVIGGAAVASKWVASRQQLIDPRHRVDPFQALAAVAGGAGGEICGGGEGVREQGGGASDGAGPGKHAPIASVMSPALQKASGVAGEGLRAGGHEDDMILQVVCTPPLSLSAPPPHKSPPVPPSLRYLCPPPSLTSSLHFCLSPWSSFGASPSRALARRLRLLSHAL